MSLKSLFTSLFKLDDTPRVINSNEKSPSDEADSPEAKRFLASGKAKAHAADHVGAIRDFDMAIKFDPTDAAAYFERAKSKRELKDERGFQRDLADGEAMMRRLDEGLKAHDEACAAYDGDDYKSAVKHFNRCLSLTPSLTSAYYWRGLSKRFLEDFAGAIDDFTKCIEANDSQKADSFHARGTIKQRILSDKAGARRDYCEAIALNPNNAAYYDSRASVSDDYDGLRDLDRAVELDPKNGQIYFARAVKKYGMQDIPGAIRDVDQFINLEPVDGRFGMSDAYSLRGTLHLAAYEVQEAVSDYSKAIQLDPSCSRAFVDRGMAKVQLGDHRGAIEDLTQAISLDPSNAEAFYWRGLARDALGAANDAQTDFAMAKRLGYDAE